VDESDKYAQIKEMIRGIYLNGMSSIQYRAHHYQN
jgi:hypothetical protein